MDPFIQVVVSVGTLLCHELAVLGTSSAHFGGSYEIAYYDGKAFQKLDELLYVYWGAIERDDGGVDLSVRVCFKTVYKDDVLFVKTVDWLDGTEEAYGFIYPVPPPGASKEVVAQAAAVRAEEFDWNSKVTCHLIAIQPISGKILCGAMMESRQGLTRIDMEVVEDDHTVQHRLHVATDLHDKIKKLATDVVANLRKRNKSDSH